MTSSATPPATHLPVSSSSTLWATASKEWVIPPKPKPGRKPKAAESSQQPDTTTYQPDEKGRKVQNRAAQRAFRERKQTQLAELQARLQLYEQGEIERNVALQNIAKRLKEENEQLRKENNTLKERVVFCEREHSAYQNDRKRRRRDSTSSVSLSSEISQKREKTAPPDDPTTSVTSAAQTPVSLDSQETPSAPSSHLTGITDNDAQDAMQVDPSSENNLPNDSCGFCSSDTSCFCRDVGLRKKDSPTDLNASSEVIIQDENSVRDNDSIAIPDVSSQNSILDNSPAFQPPVPLRRRKSRSKINSIFPIVHPAAETIDIEESHEVSASCSGDPSNCRACAGDSFGQAFCAAIGESAAAVPPCIECPCSCKSPTGCSGQPSTCDACRHLSEVPELPASGTITTDRAWRQLKSHPNVAFNDLSLLAEVVARRSKCTGPRVVISSPLESTTPERINTPKIEAPDGCSGAPTDSGPSNERVRRSSRSPPRLVPQEVLIECGRRRVREVRADAVREALRLLDAKFT